MPRNDKIALIHIAKAKANVCANGSITFNICENQTKLSDEQYRNLLKDITGKHSCSTMTDDDLDKVVKFFQCAGFVKKVEVSQELKARQKTIGVILFLARKVLGDNYESRLESFLFKKTGEFKLYKLDDKQLRQVVGWLRRYGHYQGKNNSDLANGKMR